MFKTVTQFAEGADVTGQSLVGDGASGMRWASYAIWDERVEAAYTLLAYSPIETQRVAMEGSKGRLMQQSMTDTYR